MSVRGEETCAGGAIPFIEPLESRTLLSGTDCLAPPLAGLNYDQLVRQKVADYGHRTHPVTGERGKLHTGVDFSGVRGKRERRVVAAQDGYIIRIGFSATYGQVIIVRHANGKESLYGHLVTGSVDVAEVPGIRAYPRALKNGETKWQPYRRGELPVRAGQRLGTMGNTGVSTGVHLHFEYGRAGFIDTPRKGRVEPMALVCGSPAQQQQQPPPQQPPPEEPKYVACYFDSASPDVNQWFWRCHVTTASSNPPPYITSPYPGPCGQGDPDIICSGF